MASAEPDLAARVAELEVQLVAKEANVSKLKGYLRTAKECALNANKVVEQKKDLERSLQQAKEAAATARGHCEAVESTLREKDKEREEMCAHLCTAIRERDVAKKEAQLLQQQVSAHLKRVEHCERTASDAKTSAEHAVDMQSRLSCIVSKLEMQLAKLRQRVKEEEDKSKVLRSDLQAAKDALSRQSEQMRSAAARGGTGQGGHGLAGASAQQVHALQQQVESLAGHVARLERGAAPASLLVEDGQSLDAAVAALQARLGPVEAGFARFQNALSVLAAAAGTPAGRLASPTGEGSNQVAGGPATAGLGSGVVIHPLPPAATRERIGLWGGEQPRPRTRSEESLSGTGAGHQGAVPRLPSKRAGDQGPHLGALENGRGANPAPAGAAQSHDLVEGREGKRARLDVGKGMAAPNRAHVGVGASIRRVLPLAPSSQRPAPASEAGKPALPVLCVAPLATDLVEGLIARIRTGSGPPTPETVAEVARGLQDAVASRHCPLETVVDKFESALLSCALSSPEQPSTRFSSPEASSLSEPMNVSPDAVLEEQPYTATWCSPKDHVRHSVTSLLQCVSAIDSSGARGCMGLMEALRSRLHMLAVRAHPEGHAPLYDSEAAVLCAALATICRFQGRLEALRVMVVDLLLAWGPSPRSLPRLAAALLAWPTALANPAETASDPLQRCVTAALRDMCATAEAAGREGTAVREAVAAVAGGAPARNSVARAARALHEVGVQCWKWPEVLGPTPGLAAEEAQEAAGPRWPHLQAEAPALLASLESLLDGLGAQASDSEVERSRWENMAIALEVATLFLGYAWAYEQVLDLRLLGGVGGEGREALRQRERASSMAARVASCMLRSADDPPVVRAAVNAVCGHLLRVWQTAGEASPCTPAGTQEDDMRRDAAPHALLLIRRLQQEVEGAA